MRNKNFKKFSYFISCLNCNIFNIYNINIRQNLIFLTIFLFAFLFLSGLFLKNIYAFSIKANTFVVVHKKNKQFIQAIGIKKDLTIALQKTVVLLIGKDIANNKKNKIILYKEIYSGTNKFIYSFKVVKSETYLNLFYINLICNVHINYLKKELLNLGFKVKKIKNKEKISYNTYRLRFVGNFKYGYADKFMKMMIKYSSKLKNIYVSSFSNDYVGVKIKYAGGILRLLKSIKSKLSTFLKYKEYMGKNNIIYINIKKQQIINKS
ncbi:MAG: hypothetical protein EVG15_02050 [Candidatus Acididesulfobacter diazotrophicus]|uniref:Uncharacterized protein n=1 Tax=Candidatus Acididesulfobacter diazotrophicus TaxID=2597226 RepID=A0A519BPP1_9DELT|nr:MAG: hypothetical protein EVG15_02050 [Candidatus Acididesulfobacter diazotrophicus]